MIEENLGNRRRKFNGSTISEMINKIWDEFKIERFLNLVRLVVGKKERGDIWRGGEINYSTRNFYFGFYRWGIISILFISIVPINLIK